MVSSHDRSSPSGGSGDKRSKDQFADQSAGSPEPSGAGAAQHAGRADASRSLSDDPAPQHQSKDNRGATLIVPPGTLEDDPTAPDFSYIDAWVFDLDNTLYPSETNLFKQVDKRMAEFIAKELDIDLAAARILQKEYYKKYGTTLNGLMAEHNMDPGPFLDYVHDLDLSGVEVNPQLIAALDALPGRKVIFTNGSLQHALNVTEALNIQDHFDDIFGIEKSRYVPKHEKETFERFLDATKISARTAAMFDDLSINLVPAFHLGMTTTWVRTHEDYSPGLLSDDVKDHIHHETDALAAFLHTIRTAK